METIKAFFSDVVVPAHVDVWADIERLAGRGWRKVKAAKRYVSEKVQSAVDWVMEKV